MTDSENDTEEAGDEKELDCAMCGGTVDVRTDKWWRYQWEEQPALETVEKALEKDDFRDWFIDNYVICPTCHREIQRFIQNDSEC